jgi:hypothetical protein
MLNIWTHSNYFLSRGDLIKSWIWERCYTALLLELSPKVCGYVESVPYMYRPVSVWNADWGAKLWVSVFSPSCFRLTFYLHLKNTFSFLYKIHLVSFNFFPLTKYVDIRVTIQTCTLKVPCSNLGWANIESKIHNDRIINLSLLYIGVVQMIPVRGTAT